MKITEKQLRSIINESVKMILNEGHYDNAVYQEFIDIREKVGDDAFIMELYNYLSADDIEGFIDHVKRMYDLDYNEDEEY